MKAPFLGSRAMEGLSFDDVEPLIQIEALFASRWQFRQGMDGERWEAFKRERVFPIHGRIMAMVRAKRLIEPKAVYGYFACRRDGNGLIVSDEGRAFRFDFPREKAEPHRCLADLFPDGFIAMQLVTVGKRVGEEGTRLFTNHAYSDLFYLKGLAAEATEALAALCHGRIRKELGAAEDQGERFSPGYPAFPDLLYQRKIAALLKPERIGIALTESCQMVPEYSSSAVISADPKAMHFRP